MPLLVCVVLPPEDDVVDDWVDCVVNVEVEVVVVVVYASWLASVAGMVSHRTALPTKVETASVGAVLVLASSSV